MFRVFFLFLRGLTGYVYIGVHDNIVEGVEYTYEGNLVTWTKWVPGQPNDYNMPGLPVEDCVKILVDTREWEDEVCTKMLQALCYRNLCKYCFHKRLKSEYMYLLKLYMRLKCEYL